MSLYVCGFPQTSLSLSSYTQWDRSLSSMRSFSAVHMPICPLCSTVLTTADNALLTTAAPTPTSRHRRSRWTLRQERSWRPLRGPLLWAFILPWGRHCWAILVVITHQSIITSIFKDPFPGMQGTMYNRSAGDLWLIDRSRRRIN
jgi:hypothetical protein